MESPGNFPFCKIRYYIYLALDVMMYLDHEDAFKFMFKINKEGRKFIINNFITVRNGFINDGLIDIIFDNDPSEQFNNYDKLEKNYFKALKRIMSNRILTINVKDINEE
jgi:hypothetical protein